MTANAARRSIALFALLVLIVLVPCSAGAEVTPLPLDMKAHGYPMKPEGWLSETEYRDESIHITVNAAGRKPKSSKEQIVCRWVTVKIEDPSQLRTTMSNESYEDRTLAKAMAMARSVNAVVALNADFMKYSYNIGYVLRQGVFYRDALDGTRDVLIIDDKGDFSAVPKATSEDMAQKLREMEAAGRQAINTFSFGPLLVLDGEIQDTVAPHCESHIATQRIAIAQLGELEYAVIEIDGGNGSGMNTKELATYILLRFPECKLAYNLDGGGSTHLMVGGKMIHKTPGDRTISDLIYFASAASEE